MAREESTAKVAKWAASRVEMRAGSGIVFVRTKERARLLSEAIAAEIGYGVPYITSEMSKARREKWIEGLRTGLVPVVVATSAMSTGVDIPELRWVAFADAGKAPIWVIQSAGRAARPAEGKDGFEVFDLVTDDASTRRKHLEGYCEDPEDAVELCRKRAQKKMGTASQRQAAGTEGVARGPSCDIGWFFTLAIALALYVTCAIKS